MKARLKALGVNLLVAAGSVVLLFAVLELGARLVLPRPETVLVDNVKQDVAAAPTEERELRSRRGLPGYALFKSTEYGWRLQPNVRVIIRGNVLSGKNTEVRTNSLGYRDDEVPAKTAQDFRILVLGDSIMMADYAPKEETVPAHLERRLAQLGKATKKIRVINGGTSSIDLRSEFMILMETGLSTQPDIVVEALYLNDADVSFTLNAVTYPPSIRWSRLLVFLMSRTSYLRTALAYRKRQEDRKEELAQFVGAHPPSANGDWHDNDGAFNQQIVDAFSDWGYAWTTDAWRKMEETLTLMKQVASDHDIELYVVLLPVKHQVESKLVRDEPQRQFEQVTRRLGLRHLDLLPPLREKFAADAQPLYYDHCHMQPGGNELVGGLIADLLARESSKLHRLGVSPGGDGGAAVSRPRAAATAPLPELLNRPLGLTATPDGGLLVADENENAIERIGADGRFRGRFGDVSLQQPNGVAVDAAGFVYVADTWKHRVLRFAPDGSPKGELPAPPGGYYAPRDVAVSPEGDIFVANTGQGRIVHYDAKGGLVGAWGSAGKADGQFQEALALAAGGREVYVADYLNARVQVFNFEGRFLRSWPVAGWTGAPTANRPGLAVFRDRLFVSDPVANAILSYPIKPQPGEEPARITSPEIMEPAGVAVSRDGMLYVASGATGMVAAVDLKAKGDPVVLRFAPR